MRNQSFLSITLTLLIAVVSGSSVAQVTYDRQKLEPIPRHKAIDISDIQPGYDVEMEYLEAPYPGGEGYKEFLKQQKEKSAQLYPRKEGAPAGDRSIADPPVIQESFLGNNSTTGRPLDNHLAYSEGGQVVSVINTHMAVMRPDGSFIKGINFSQLFNQLDIDDFIFDPKIIYDPAEDRWILAMMTGRSCFTTQLVFGFSQSNDAAGAWNFYLFDGCPFDNTSFADFPMFAITQDELFFTYNAVDELLSWQEGFVETIILQINKHDGYSGSDLRSMMWSNIDFNGKPIRNVCPVEAATEELNTNCYFLSNRNFALQNDSIFIIEVSGSQDDPDLELRIDVQQTDIAYGLPPDARMAVGGLATNDARVLDAIYYQGWIQFVGNTIHIDNGNSAIYHGYIEDVEGTRQVHGYVLDYFDGHLQDLGYPGISYSGLTPADRDVIIVASHSSNERPPGHSAMYVDNNEDHSEWVTLKEGQSHIEMIPNSDLERWGDYAGSQRAYSQPGKVWVSASFGQSNLVNNTWISSLEAPGLSSSTKDHLVEKIEVIAYPNPTADKIQIRFDVPLTKEIVIFIYDSQGRMVDKLAEGKLKRGGEAVLHFSAEPLPAGNYFIQGFSGTDQVFSEQIHVSK